MRIVFALLMVCVLPLSAPAGAESLADHDFHYSRLTLEWNPESATWQAILRLFTDDLESALSLAQPETGNWRLGDEREAAEADDAIASYTSAHWRLLDTDGIPMQWHFIGKEVDFDLTFVYLESDTTSFERASAFSSDGFFELFEDQVNEITASAFESTKRIWLTEEDPVQPLFPIPHD